MVGTDQRVARMVAGDHGLDAGEIRRRQVDRDGIGSAAEVDHVGIQAGAIAAIDQAGNIARQVERVGPCAAVQRAGERHAGRDGEVILRKPADQVLESPKAVVEPGDLARVGAGDDPVIGDVVRDQRVIAAAAVDGARAAQDAGQPEPIRARSAAQVGDVAEVIADASARAGVAAADLDDR